MSAARLAVQPPLIRNLARICELWTNVDWGRSSEDEAMANDERRTTTDIDQAQIISSRQRPHAVGQLTEYHRPMLDLDFPAVVVPSSTPGHSHLYLDMPLAWEQYEKLLDVMAEIGLLEDGYVAASKRRRATFLRLPWVRKGKEEALPPQPSLSEIEDFLARAPEPDPWREPVQSVPF